jgi:C-terminal processing protease CtpA/Prc
LRSLELKRTLVTSSGAGQLKDHPNLISLDVKYCPLDDNVMSQLASITSLRVLKLYGTQVTVESAALFAQKHMAVEVDHRRGAFLGVACPRAPEPCYVMSVQTDTAAERAGIKSGDLIIEFGDQIVRSFDDLKRLISRHKSGDKTTIVTIVPGASQSMLIQKTEQLRFNLQLKKHALGLEITGLEMKSPWYTRGLRQGDVINIFGNQSVLETKMMEEEFKMAKDNEMLNITFYRKPNKKKSDVTFGEWK